MSWTFSIPAPIFGVGIYYMVLANDGYATSQIHRKFSEKSKKISQNLGKIQNCKGEQIKVTKTVKLQNFKTSSNANKI